MKEKIAKIIILMGTVIVMLSGCGEQGNISTENEQIEIATDTETKETVEEAMPEEKAENIEEAMPEEKAENIEEAMSEEKVEIIEEAIPEETAESIEEQTVEIEEETLGYTFTEMSAVKYAKAAVNVRSLPSTDGEKIGGLAIGEEVSVTGVCNETGWFRINYGNNVEAFVSNMYLIDEKPVTEAPMLIQNSEQDNNSSSEKVENSTATGVNNQNNSNSVTIPEHEETEGNLVWVPVNGGTKYHSRSSCSNMKDPMQVSLETAVANGYTACKRCH